jgi:hypothetical protein
MEVSCQWAHMWEATGWVLPETDPLRLKMPIRISIETTADVRSGPGFFRRGGSLAPLSATNVPDEK